MQILRLMHGYDENNILLLPPRAPGESLPIELLEYYKEYCSQLKNDDGSFRHSLVYLQSPKSFICLSPFCIEETCFYIFDLCAAEHEAGPDIKVTKTVETHKEDKRSQQNTTQLSDNREKETHTFGKPAELCEWKHFRSRYRNENENHLDADVNVK